MLKRKVLSILAIMMLNLAIVVSANAATKIAMSCSQSDVQAAINLAVAGDTVNIPPGNCTWVGAIQIPSSKKITLQGAGIDSTVITSGNNGMVINDLQSGSRITGITFSNSYIQIDGDGWRVDNCKFHHSSSFNEGVFVRGDRETRHPTGLVDHCLFINARVLVAGWAGLLANVLWSQPLNLGTGNNVVYVEDCTFTFTLFGNAIDSNYGGRYVFRYNTVTDTSADTHSVQGGTRAARKWEIYNNTFNQVSRTMWVPMMLRGGTGVVFNNTLTGTWSTLRISLDNVRSCENRSTSGMCDGSSPWDGNQINGYPCRDQIGRSTDTYLWTAGTPYPPQALEPAYAWNNKHGATDVTFFQHNCALSQEHIQLGRDYYNNLIKPGYTPYTYPHPLITAWGSSIVAPRNFRLSAN